MDMGNTRTQVGHSQTCNISLDPEGKSVAGHYNTVHEVIYFNLRMTIVPRENVHYLWCFKVLYLALFSCFSHIQHVIM